MSWTALLPRPISRRAVIEVLPMPMSAKRLDERMNTDTYFALDADLALTVRPVAGLLAPPEAPDDRAFYRWILGHHLAFCVWRQLIEVLHDMVDNGATQAGIEESAWWYERYTAMFLYAGSCTADTYARVIRPKMVAAHPAFSGVWAQDHRRVLQLLARLEVRAMSPLNAALKRNRVVHMAVAKALVPYGGSLLKQEGRRANQGATDAEGDIFDRFFRVERMTVRREVFLAHLLRRAAAVSCDLSIHPYAIPEHENIYRLLPADLMSMVRDIAIVSVAVDCRGGKWTA